ncbi:related to DNA repair helicase ERCC6 [Cephalotrichum gorgonifer]|uniref:Related to DNA repair helicase ERCC6 n=1 Tax=Cephalotrichum gorgonifer TaxID=2041049 RepID=A0AAE8N0C6_9PEZI|nr:related to DNA repair helicase ERCC6 [Cephalotrichum gorgonifer]
MPEPDIPKEAPTSTNDSQHPHKQAQPNQPGEAGDVASALQGLVDIQDHADIERDVSAQVKAAAIKEENEKDEGRISNLRAKIKSLEEQKVSLTAQRVQKERAHAPRSQLTALSAKIQSCTNNIADLLDEVVAFEDRIEERNQQQAAAAAKAQQTDGAAEASNVGPAQQEGEDRQAFLIRTGKITPFAGLGDAEVDDDGDSEPLLVATDDTGEPQIQTSHQVLRQPGFATTQIREPIPDDIPAEAPAFHLETEFGLRPRKRKAPSAAEVEAEAEQDDAGPSSSRRKRRARLADDDADFVATASGSDISDVEDSAILESAEEQPKGSVNLSIIDDAKESVYQARLSTWVRERRQLRESLGEDGGDDGEEWFKPTPGKPNKTIYEDYSLPEEVYDFLFPFQRVGIKWLAQLHRRREGGILCDEMGLGKTVQVISFLAALHFSKKLDGPAIIVAPATLISQWVKHFHTWWPPLRISILHSTGSGMLNPQLEDSMVSSSRTSKKSSAAKKIINNVLRHGHILVTTYRGLDTYLDELSSIEWSYAALDEGHQIRNRSTEASKACKQLNTWHRIILSGTPVQNNLKELYSLFEFVYPGLLGSDLRDFTEHFEMPIREGHYRGASSLAIATGDRCSRTLRATVKPYMLRRVKADVADSLPPKSEQVLFCKLTLQQENIYQAALDSPQVKRVFNSSGRRSADVFSAIDMLRKICNHPDLRYVDKSEIADWGHPDRSAKVQVLVELLRVSKRFGHKTLVFSQSLELLNIITRFLQSEKLTFVRMDGRTPQGERQTMVDRFNHSSDIDVFLLTPQTGGVGLNLTGADRVILFDPSWNPATDRQAIERAWRLGQTKPVKIYRLLTPGTIEEKMYRKQLYKQFVSDKVMSDTEFNRYVDTSNLFDLFTYGTKDPETRMFDNTPVTYESHSSGRTRVEDRHQPRGLQEPSAEEPAETERKALDAVNQVGAVEEYADEGAEEKDMLDAVFTNNAEVVYEHENVVNSKHRVRADKRLTEQEADRLNERTVQFLREQANRAYFARHGGPGGKTAKAPSGRAIGSQTRQWNLGNTKRTIIDFLNKRGRKADSGSIVSHFNREYSDVPKDLFMRALNSVTTKEDGPRGGIVWKLKANL